MVDKKLINNKNNSYCVDKKLIDIGNDNNTNSYNSNDEIVDSNYESKYIDIIADHISSAILRLKSKELLRLNEPQINNQVINSIQLSKLGLLIQSNKLSQLNQSNNSVIQFNSNSVKKLNEEEITGLNKLPKLNQHTTEIKQVDYDGNYSEICNNDYNYDCYENCNDNDNHKNKSFHDFDNKKDL